MKTVKKLIRTVLIIIGVIIVINWLSDDIELAPLEESKMKMEISLEGTVKAKLKYPDTYKKTGFFQKVTGDTLTGQLQYTAENGFGVPIPRVADVWVRLTDGKIDPSKPSSKVIHSK